MVGVLILAITGTAFAGEKAAIGPAGPVSFSFAGRGGPNVSAEKGDDIDDIDGGDSSGGEGHRASVAYDTRFE